MFPPENYRPRPGDTSLLGKAQTWAKANGITRGSLLELTQAYREARATQALQERLTRAKEHWLTPEQAEAKACAINNERLARLRALRLSVTL